MYDAIMAETISLTGHGGDQIEAYLARPLGPGPFGSVVVIHHMPGLRRADQGDHPDVRGQRLHRRVPEPVLPGGARRQPGRRRGRGPGAGGVPDERLVGDVGGAAAYLRAMPNSNGKVGVIGYCSGGRQSFLAACSLPLDAAVDCYGAFIVGTPPEGMPLKVGPIVDLAPRPVLPAARAVRRRRPVPVARPGRRSWARRSMRPGRRYEFHSYAGAGHAFFSVNRPAYRPEAASDGWQKIWDFYGRYLARAERETRHVHVPHRERRRQRQRQGRRGLVRAQRGHRLLRPPGARRPPSTR